MKINPGTLRALIVAALLGLAIQPAAAVVLSLEPDAALVDVGDPLSVSLVAAGLTAGGPDSLGAFDVDLRYDPAVLSFTGLTLGTGLGDVNLFEALDLSVGDLGGGLINIAESSLLEADPVTCFFCLSPFLDDIQGSSFALATLTFDVGALAPGATTPLDIERVNEMRDAFGLPLTVDATLGAVVSGAAPPAGVVATPGTWMLLVGGLAALWRRRAGHG